MSANHHIFIISYPEYEKIEEEKNPDEIIKWTYGLRLYQKYTGAKDEDLKGLFNSVHPSKEKDGYQIHYFDIQDKYWPAISNIIKHCDGIVFAIKIDNYDDDKGLEFVREWMINLEDIEEEIKPKKPLEKIIIGVFEDENNVLKETRDKIIDYCNHFENYTLKFYWAKIKSEDSGQLDEAFTDLRHLIENKENKEEKTDDDDEYDEKMNMYLNY